MARVEVFVPDIIIAGDDGQIYHISKADLQQFKITPEEAASKEYKRVKDLLNAGVSTAAIPTDVEVALPPGAEGSEASHKKSEASSESEGIMAAVPNSDAPAGTAAIVTCYMLNCASLKKHTIFTEADDDFV